MTFRFSLGLLATLSAYSLKSTLASPVTLPTEAPSQCRKTTVAILGGGMAGVTAAQALHNASISDFLIVEYRDVLGGRTYDVPFGQREDGTPYTIEYGANWIHGLGNHGGPKNPVYNLIKKYNMSNTPSDYGSILTYNETGFTDYSHLLVEFGEVYKRAATQAGHLLSQNLQDQTVRTGLALAGWNPSHHDMARQAVEWWSWDFDAAYPPEQSSFIFGIAGYNVTFNQFSHDNNLVTDPRGYSAIVKGEAATFLEDDDSRLLLSTRVRDISHSDSGVVIHNDDGSCISADYAICTFSVGVLQSDAVSFTPDLPEWKRTAIHKFTMGTYTKVFLQFNETFWPDDKEYFLYASPHRRGHFPIWQSLSTEGFMPGSHILFATVVGDESYRIEQQTDEETMEECLDVLRHMFPHARIPEPTAFTYPRWTKLPWARGSYSNWPASTTLEMHQNLRANVGRLWFAGEATSAEYFGFLHGAWFEGREAGAQVAAVMSGRCTVYGEDELCGERLHYEELHGTSPLENYSLKNGWAVSSFYESKGGEAIKGNRWKPYAASRGHDLQKPL